MNIVDPILFHCKQNPSAAAICTPGTSLNVISYGRLARFIYNIGRMASSFGLGHGNVAAILVKDDIFHAALILGLSRLGIVTVSCRDARLPRELHVDALLTDGLYPVANTGKVIRVDLSWAESESSPDEDEPSQGGGDEICRIILTSGTTGEPKGIAFTHNMILERNARYEFVKGDRFPLCARLYCELGISTSPGFRNMLHMLWRGGTIFFFGEDEISTVQAFGLYNIQCMIASPYSLSEYVKFYEANGTFKCGLDHIISSGGLLSKSLSERVRSRMCSNLISSYGSTEVGTVASAPAHLIADIPGAVGHVTPGVSVEIVNEFGNMLPIGKEGIVRIRSPYNVKGYVGNPEEAKNAFRDDCFYPGDIGYVTQHRMLVISGREKTRLNLGGDKVRPEIIEEVLASFGTIEAAAVFAVPNELGLEQAHALIVTRSTIDEKALQAHCEAKLPRAFVPVRFITVDELPRNEMGKIDRHRLLDLAKTKMK